MMTMGNQPHVLVVPFPAQGHVAPLMKLSYFLADREFKITFVTTEAILAMLIDPSQVKGKEIDRIDLVSIPDGLTTDERKNLDKFHIAFRNNAPVELEKLIRNLNESGKNGKISCVIADEVAGWALDVARKLGIRHASFYPSAAGIKALTLHIPKMIEIGAIQKTGYPKKDDTITWSPTMPGTKAAHLPWNCMQGIMSLEVTFQEMILNSQSSKNADWVLCNTFYELEPEAIALIPNLLPIGPLLTSNQLGSFWTEELTCLNWLDQQAANSVIYLAFGSIAMLDQRQIEELTLGLELLGRAFLWVIRTGEDMYGRPSTTLPDGFVERVADFGKIVHWAPQLKVLSHPSIACFVSHCGWNSIIEGVSMGVPFICWPYFADQPSNATYITDVWKIGLGLNVDEYGIVSRDEIKGKLDQFVTNKDINKNTPRLKELATKNIAMGGSSIKNLELFIEELKY